jgi:hypothetical protein
VRSWGKKSRRGIMPGEQTGGVKFR